MQDILRHGRSERSIKIAHLFHFEIDGAKSLSTGIGKFRVSCYLRVYWGIIRQLGTQ